MANIQNYEIVQDTSLADHPKLTDASSDESAQLLMQLTIDSKISKQNEPSDGVQQHFVSDVDCELPVKSFESATNVTTELNPYYIYVIEESASKVCSDHVDDLIRRYRLQEGSNVTELESANFKYV